MAETDIFAEAAQQIEFVRQWASQQGFKCAALPKQVTTENLGIAFTEIEFVVLGIMPGTPSLYITAGAAQRVHEDRLAALEAANNWTRGNPAFPASSRAGPMVGTSSFSSSSRSGWCPTRPRL